jgi:hypothetical protein
VYGLNASISPDDRVVVACRLLTADARASPKIASRERIEDIIEATTQNFDRGSRNCGGLHQLSRARISAHLRRLAQVAATTFVCATFLGGLYSTLRSILELYVTQHSWVLLTANGMMHDWPEMIDGQPGHIDTEVSFRLQL